MKQLDPKAVWLFFFSYIVRWIFFLVVLGLLLTSILVNVFKATGAPSSGSLLWLWLIIPVFLIFLFIWAKLSYRFYRYELTESGFRKESGVIYKHYVTIPYERIQNVDIYRGILARLLGLSDLQIQTAGLSGGVGYYGRGVAVEGRLLGLSKKVAEELRDELINRARQSKTQGL